MNESKKIITARYYAERGIATASRLPVCLSVRDVEERDHIGGKSLKIILDFTFS